MVRSGVVDNRVFIIDASAIVSYGLQLADQLDDIFAGMKALGEAGRLVTIEPVVDEVGRHHRGAYKRLLQIKDLLLVEYLTEDVRDLNEDILTRFPRLIKDVNNPSDSFLIALASIHGWHVVSDETARLRRNRKIPTVCEAFGVEHVTGLDFKIVLEGLD